MNYQPYWLTPRPATDNQRTATRRYVHISQLPEDQKRRLWLGIQKYDPALADMMQNDPFFKHLQASFNATVVIEKNRVEDLSK